MQQRWPIACIHASRTDLLADHARWQMEMERPHPDTCHAMLNTFLADRPEHLTRSLSEQTGLRLRTLIVDVPQASVGTVYIEGLPLAAGEQRISCFQDVPITIERTGCGRYGTDRMEGCGQRWTGDPCGTGAHYEWCDRSLRPYFRDQAGTACNSEVNKDSPSVLPKRSSAARSGCGIMPNTLRPLLHTPAMLSLLRSDWRYRTRVLRHRNSGRALGRSPSTPSGGGIGMVTPFAMGDRDLQRTFGTAFVRAVRLRCC